MAVVFEGFSIREYASKMRSVDVVKCWPFSTGASSSSDDDDDDDDNGNSKVDKQTMESLLPSITVTKFRWWSDELHLLKSIELANIQSTSNSDMVKIKLQETQPRNQSDWLQVNLHVGEKSDEILKCPVCGVFAASTVNALNAHVDTCLSQASTQDRRKMRMSIKPTKLKTPKKRSITEIFAVAPQIHTFEAAENDNFLDEDENGCLEELNCKIEGPKMKKKKKKKKVAIVKELMNKKRKLKNNKNNNQDELIANKENGRRQKLQTPVNVNRKPNNTLCGRGSKTVSILRKKPSFKSLSAKKKSKVVDQASKLIVEHEMPSSLVRSILKYPAKGISRQNAATCNLKATAQASTCGVQHSVRHVSFSGKDDILGPCKKHVASCEKSICCLDLDSFELSKKGHQNEVDKEFPARETNRNDDKDVSFSTENGIQVQAMTEKQQLPDIHHNVDRTKFLRPHVIEKEKANHFSDRSLPPGQVVLDSGKLHKYIQGNQTAFHSPPFTVVPGHFSAVKKIQNPFVNSQVCAGVSTALNYSSPFFDYFGDHTQDVAISSKVNPRASFQPSSSGFSSSKNENEIASFTSQFASENIPGHALSCRPLYHLPPIEPMGRLCPFPEWKPKEVSFKEKYRDEEFFGLPLNSQGELVQAKASGKIGFNHLKKLSPASGSSCSINNLVMPRSMDDNSIVKGKDCIEGASFNNELSLFPAQNHMKENAAVHSAKLGATELQGRRNDCYYVNSDRRCNHSCLMHPDLNLMNNEKDMTHSNENAEKMLLNSPPQTMRLMGKDVTICPSSDERQGFADGKVWNEKEIIKEHHPQNSCVDRHFKQDWCLDPASGKFKKTPCEVKSNEASPRNVHMKPLESTFFQPGLNWQANPKFHYRSLIVGRNTNPNSHHCPHPPTSHAVFDTGANFQESFSYRRKTLGVSSQVATEPASHRNYQNINGNSVEFKAKQNLGKSSFNFPFLHPDHAEHVQPSWLWGSSNLMPWLLQAPQQVKAPSTPPQPFPQVGGRRHPYPNHFVSHSPTVSCDHNPMISYLNTESSVGQPSIAHLQLPGIKPTTSVNMSQRDRTKVKDRMKPENVGICQKTRKRRGAKEDYPSKPVKVPNLGIQYESRAATQLTRENFIDDIQCNMGSLEIEPERNEASFVGWIPNESQCNGFGIDSSKVDCVTRPCPIKLSPGVKHILKPSQNVDQDNSRLIHSTIPSASVTEYDIIVEAQKKSTKIYRTVY
ncbi:hypothetical protein PTKIN_Ptkin08bG0077400 [Pterospermum kingtungense]